MIWYQALILGIVQGITEFLPISSSGHLILVPYVFGWQSDALAFDVFLHFGTLCALLIYFYKDLFSIGKGLFFSVKNYGLKISKYSGSAKMGMLLIIGCIPAVFFGFLLDSYIETTFRSALYVALFLLFGSVLMSIAEILYKKNFRDNNLTEWGSLVIGFFQALAILPGTSRSGATISGGMIIGLDRETAARFSFMLSIPIILGATIFKLGDLVNLSSNQIGIQNMFIGFFASFFVGLLCIAFLIKFLQKYTLLPFIIYRILLAFVILTVFLMV